MKIIRTLSHVVMLTLTIGLVGCQMTPKQLARNATVATLTFSGASKETAQKVKQIAVDIQDAVNEDGTVNRAALLRKVDEQIAKLEQKQRAVLMALRGQIVDIVIQALANNQDITTVLIIIRDVAEGTEEGADIVIQSFN